MAVASYMPGRCIPILIYHSARKWNKGVRLWSPHSGGGNGWQLMSSMKYIYVLLSDTWLDECKYLSAGLLPPGKTSPEIHLHKWIWELLWALWRSQGYSCGEARGSPPPIPYTLLLQYQFTAPGEAQGISRVCWWWGGGVCFFYYNLLWAQCLWKLM